MHSHDPSSSTFDWALPYQSMSRTADALRARPRGSAVRATAEAGSRTAAWTAALTLLIAVLTFWLAYDGGTYGEVRRTTVAIVLWWSLAFLIALGFLPFTRVPRALIVSAAALAGFALLALASTGWADSAERAVDEFARSALYVGVLVLAGLAATRGTLGRWVDGIALGIVATGLLALVSRLFPDLVSGREALRFLPSALARLSYPRDYWNGLAIFVALAFPLLLRAGLTARLPLGAAALGVLPALAAAIYLTSSRGGVVTAFIGIVLFVALAAGRLEAAGLAALALAGSAVAVAVVASRTELVNRPDSSAAVTQGRSAAVLVALACALTAAAYVLARRRLAGRDLGARVRLGKNARRAAMAGAALLAVAAVVAADPVERFERFKAAPPPAQGAGDEDPLAAHIVSGGSSGRWQQWETALDEFASAPVVGRGAGSYEAWWAQHGSLPGFNRDAHSLYFETLGELGLVGFLLLVVAFATGVLAGWERLTRARGAQRTTIAAVLAAFLAYAFAAGIDWMWEMTVVSLVGMTLLGLLAGPATLPRDLPAGAPVRPRWLPIALRAGAVACALAIVVVEMLTMLSRLHVERSQAAIRSGDVEAAVDDALTARRLEPWAATPYLQLALLEQDAGDLAAAREWIGEAIDRDPSDWRLWVVATRLETTAKAFDRARESLARARELNPRSPLFTDAGPGEAG